MLLIHSQDLSIHYFLGQFFSRATAHAIYWQKIIGAEIVQKISYICIQKNKENIDLLCVLGDF